MKHTILAVTLSLANTFLPAKTKAQQTADSLILHFWDSLPIDEYAESDDQQTDLAAWAIDEMPAFTELLHEGVSASVTAESYSSVMEKAEKAGAESLWHCMRDMAEDCFHNPNSAFQNDEIYIPILEKLMKSRYMSGSDSTRYGFQLKMLKKNRIGTIAAELDLRIDKKTSSTQVPERKRRTKKTVRLSELCGDSTLVLFYDPTCEHCREQIEEFGNNEHITGLCKRGILRMVFVNVEPKRKNKNVWGKDLPDGWVFATDYRQAVIKQHIYYLPFVPQLYILGKGRVVRGRKL
ncbi:MAG: DUF5106 domain-containing protein [Bacteroides sp.]|nr:DUF5106 domain-containing protein [Roseburia sp.]MCM1347604.1 DUF5106 domain-containing protein [Bacteroides sp.]MCM1422048.1 DUF5106 domain-containing protein [Bacteroides sp.]